VQSTHSTSSLWYVWGWHWQSVSSSEPDGDTMSAGQGSSTDMPGSGV